MQRLIEDTKSGTFRESSRREETKKRSAYSRRKARIRYVKISANEGTINS